MSRVRGHESRHLSASRDEPDVDDNGRLSGRSIQDTANRVFLPPIRQARRLTVLGQMLLGGILVA
jgi:hypothetical protein